MSERAREPLAARAEDATTADRIPPRRQRTRPVRVVTSTGTARTERPDQLATEEPMAIQARGRGQDPVSVSVTMRTPGNDFELAAGFLYTEGLVRDRGAIAAVRYCDVAPSEQHYNVVTVDLTEPFTAMLGERHFYASSSCGICGKAPLEQVALSCPVLGRGPVVRRSTVLALPGELRRSQSLFERTGGLHGAGLYLADGTAVVTREDVGRHNAVDKVVGHQLLAGRLPARDGVLMVSGRVSFELVQKAAQAEIAVLCAVSAPSSLAVEAAERLNMTVVGFLRGESFNIYSHPERVDLTR